MKHTLVYKTYHETQRAYFYGDQIFLRELLKDHVIERTVYPDLRDLEGAIVSVRACENLSYIDQFNKDTKHLKWLIVVVTGNEDSSNFYRGVTHPNHRIWLQNPNQTDEADRYLPLGYPTPFEPPKEKRIYDWFFSGQITHPRRKDLAATLKDVKGGLFIETDGFDKGLPHAEYIKKMAQSEVVLCPGGAVTPDTYRIYEALECGCIPIIDEKSGYRRFHKDYWEKIFGEHPLITVDEWDYELYGILEELSVSYEEKQKEIVKWWSQYKKNLVKNLLLDIKELSK